jgi:hypothetical protein
MDPTTPLIVETPNIFTDSSIVSTGIDYCNRIYKWVREFPLIKYIAHLWLQVLSSIYLHFDTQRSEYYSFKASWELDELFGLSLTLDEPNKEIIWGNCFNKVNKCEFEQHKDAFDKKKGRLQKFLEVHPEYKEIGEIPFIQITGICCGIVLDLGKKYVVDGLSVESLSSSIEKGGSLDAEIFQAVNKNIKSKVSTVEALNILISRLRKQDCDKAIYDLLKTARPNIAIFLHQIIKSQIKKYDLASIRQISEDKEKNNFYTNYLFSSEDISTDEIKNALSLLVYNTRQHRFPGTENWIVDDNIIYSKLTQAMAREVDKIYNEKIALASKVTKQHSDLIKRRSQLIAEIEMAMFIFEYLETGDCTNFKYSMLLEPLIFDINREIVKSLAKELFKIDVVSMKPLMSDSIYYANDEKYLQNLDKLAEGYYYASFDTDKSAHAISLIKDQKGEWHIIDPNYGLLPEKKEIKKYLAELINSYKPPIFGLSSNGQVNHNISIFKVEALPSKSH